MRCPYVQKMFVVDCMARDGLVSLDSTGSFLAVPRSALLTRRDSVQPDGPSTRDQMCARQEQTMGVTHGKGSSDKAGGDEAHAIISRDRASTGRRNVSRSHTQHADRIRSRGVSVRGLFVLLGCATNGALQCGSCDRPAARRYTSSFGAVVARMPKSKPR